MQQIKLELNHTNFYCPATGVYILKDGEECNESAPSLMGYWVDEVIDEPFIKNPDLSTAWEKYRKENFNEDDQDTDAFELLQNFLAEYPENNWVVFKITQCYVMHGHHCHTAWLVIDMETETV